MFEMILPPFADQIGVFNLFNYITFRAGGALLTAFAIASLLGRPIIRQLERTQGSGQPERDLALYDVEAKTGTPTMGGLIIWSGLVGAVLLWADLTNPYLVIAFVVALAFAGVGFLDDYTKLARGSPDGISGRLRLTLEFIVAGFACAIIFGLHGAHTPSGHASWGPLDGLSQAIASWAPPTAATPNIQSFAGGVAFPFVNDFFLPLGLLFIVFGSIVVVGWSNAVNFTDGLDGLAIVPSMFSAAAFALIAYMAGNVIFSDYLGIAFVPGTGELAVLSAALVGAGMGFLWYNAHPASVFMGDTGSLGIGGLLGILAVAVKHEFVLAIIGGLFVMEILSVVSQVGWFRLTRSMTGRGRRIFKMAPLHHHFQKLGWTETHIVVRFWILSALFALLGLATLKLR